MSTTALNVAPSAIRSMKHVRVGRGRSIAQHGELFQGQIEDQSGRHRRCLLSLPCNALYSEACFEPDWNSDLAVYPAHKQKAKKAVELTLGYLNALPMGGVLRIETNITEAKGYGSSTADCIAAAKAVADAFSHALSQSELGRLVVEAEIASDNFMFQHAVLFAHREGVVLEDYAQELPKLEVLGIDTAKESRVETLEYPPAVYTWRQLQSFCTLTSALRRAIRLQDARLLGRVATASSLINQLFLPKPIFLEIKRLADSVGALGVAVAHSGTVLSVLLDPNDEQLEHKFDQLNNGFAQLGVSQTMRFRT